MSKKLGSTQGEYDSFAEFGTPVLSEEIGTNISRSGRVRKKSSKLLDYESTTDETERRKGSSRTVTFKKEVTFHSKSEFEVQDHSQDENHSASDTDEEFNGYPADNGDDFAPDMSAGDSGSDDLSDENEDINDIIGVKPKSVKIKLEPQDSVYVTENAKKKRRRKPVKTEKKARFSAYMLWAKEVRKEIMRANPNIDFSQLSTRLSVLWASVPYTEKYSWKNKAKRLALMAKNATRIEDNRQQLQTKTALGTYINKRNLKKNVVDNNIIKSPRKPKQKNVTRSPSTKTMPKGVSTFVTKPIKSTTQSIDIAAHLKLLGESLERIGERLQQHDGGIAVSGSLSVLLDSLLCSSGPLLCLTKYVDQLNGCPPEKLNKLVDNVSYIMPGL